MDTEERYIQMSVNDMAGLVLESLLEYASADQALCEGRLGGFVGDVRRMLDMWRNNPEEFERLAAQGGNAAYERLLKTVKDALAKRGITATGHDPITGRPNVEKSADHDQRMEMQAAVSALKDRIARLQPSLSGTLPDSADDSSKLMKPARLGGRCGLKCKSIGNVSRMVASLDGDDGIEVVRTGSKEYRFDQDRFTQTDWFITLADGAEDSGQDTAVAQ